MPSRARDRGSQSARTSVSPRSRRRIRRGSPIPDRARPVCPYRLGLSKSRPLDSRTEARPSLGATECSTIAIPSCGLALARYSPRTPLSQYRRGIAPTRRGDGCVLRATPRDELVALSRESLSRRSTTRVDSSLPRRVLRTVQARPRSSLPHRLRTNVLPRRERVMSRTRRSEPRKLCQNCQPFRDNILVCALMESLTCPWEHTPNERIYPGIGDRWIVPERRE